MLRLAADDHESFATEVTRRGMDKKCNSVAELRELMSAEFERVRMVEMDITYPGDDRLRLQWGGRSPYVEWRGGSDRADRIIREWRDLDGRAWFPWLAVAVFRCAVPVLLLAAWLAVYLSSEPAASSLILILFLIVVVFSFAFVATSYGKSATFRAARAVRQPFAARVEHLTWSNVVTLLGSILIPALSLILTVVIRPGG